MAPLPEQTPAPTIPLIELGTCYWHGVSPNWRELHRDEELELLDEWWSAEA